MNWSTPFEHEFMRTALLMAVVVGTVCAVFSCFLVLKGWSLMGDAVAHAVLPGIVLAYWAGLPLPVGAFASGLLCAVGSGFIQSRCRVKEDTVLGVVFTGLFALGLILFTRIESDQHLNHILFGNLLGIPRAEFLQTCATGAVVLGMITLRHRDLLLYCFDPGQARTLGLSTHRLQFLFLALLSLTIVTSLRAVGVILVVAMLVTPGCLGFLMADRFRPMVLYAVGSSVIASVAGTYASFLLDASTGACIVLSQASLFILALFLAPKKGLLAFRGRRLRRSGAERSTNPVEI